MSRTPAWASALVEQVAEDEGRDFLPVLHWRRWATKKRTTGSTWVPEARSPYRGVGEITITAGQAPRMNHRIVLLHELAHWLLPIDVHHSDEFWDKAWELFRRYKVPIRLALRTEGTSRGESYQAYRRGLRNPNNGLYILVEDHGEEQG